MTATLSQRVREALVATRVHSPTELSWHGMRVRVLAARLARALPVERQWAFTESALSQLLYRQFYTQGRALPCARRPHAPPDTSLADGFVDRLSVANRSGSYWEGGWVRCRSAEDDVVVARDRLRLRVKATACRTADGETAVRFPGEHRALSPGFYMATGGELFRDADVICRVYFNVSASRAIQLMAAITERLRRLPFRFKVWSQLSTERRTDSCVLYLYRQHFSEAAPLLAECAGVDHVNDVLAPVFTKVVADGCAVAETPVGSRSFGAHRCDLVARAILRAHRQRVSALDARLTIVREDFERVGLSFERPHLNPGSSDDYVLPAAPFTRTISASRLPEHVLTVPDAALDAAMSIGRRLCSTSLWHAGRCTWLAPEPWSPGTRVWETLDGDFYAGTSGVGLFLAELTGWSDDDVVRETAVGALRHAASACEQMSRPGLFTGVAGAALAVIRGAQLLGAESLLQRGRDLLERALAMEIHHGDYDVVGGAAGRIIAALMMHRRQPDRRLVAAAVKLGDGLLAAADRSAGTLSWSCAAPRNLTGLSHGAAGIAVALIELYATTQEARFESAARAALAYESLVFSRRRGNWPDFRHTKSKAKQFVRAWCHGAPGIALARIRALEVLGDPVMAAEATIALRTTVAACEDALAQDRADLCICHGLAGNAEVLRTGAAAGLCADVEMVRTLVERVVAHVGRRVAECDGAPVGGQPGAMLGSAGLGTFLLRSNDECVRSLYSLSPRFLYAA